MNGTFLGHTAAPTSVKTVAPPAGTSLICSMKEEAVNNPQVYICNQYQYINITMRSETRETVTNVKQPGGDSVSCPQLFKSIRFIFLKNKLDCNKQEVHMSQRFSTCWSFCFFKDELFALCLMPKF